MERYIKLFEDVANDSANLNSAVLSTFQKADAAFQGFSKTFNLGQVWVQVRNGKIINAGVNLIPK